MSKAHRGKHLKIPYVTNAVSATSSSVLFGFAVLLLCTFLNLTLTIRAAPAYARCYLARRAGELE